MSAIINFANDRTIEQLVIKLSKNIRTYSKNDMPKKFLFVCGKEISTGITTNRDVIVKQLSKIDNRIKCLVAENLYFDETKYNILHFENLLAEISDYIIIILESPGTFCELGAFVNNKKLINKLIVINEDNINFKKSFITKGPLKLIEKNHNLYLYQGNMINSPNIKFLINKIHKEKPISVKHTQLGATSIELKSLICDLLNLIYIFGPVCNYELELIYKKFFNINKINISNHNNFGISNINEVLNLLCKMNLIEYTNKYYVSNKSIVFKNFSFNLSEIAIDSIRATYLCKVHKDIDRARALI